jgi:hypothetical protein
MQPWGWQLYLVTGVWDHHVVSWPTAYMNRVQPVLRPGGGGLHHQLQGTSGSIAIAERLLVAQGTSEPDAVGASCGELAGLARVQKHGLALWRVGMFIFYYFLRQSIISVSFTVSLLVSVSMICPLIRVDRVLKSLTIIVWGTCMLWALVKFFYECGYICIWSIDIQNWEFFLVDFSFNEYEVSFLILFDNLAERWFYSLLEWLLQLISWFYLLGNFFSSPLLWGSFCPWHWGVFPVCSKILGLVYVSSLLFYVFLLGNWICWCLKILRNSDCCFLLFLMFFLWLYGYLLLGLLKEVYFLAFSRV